MSSEKRKLGIALGGGGAKGYAHIGVLEVFSEHGINFDVVTGTSAGALVGASYACGALPKLKEFASEIKLSDIPLLLSPSWSLAGLFSGKNAFEGLSTVLAVEKIEELRIPFGATAVNLLSGELVEFSQGDLRTAIRSSIAIPGLFTPVSLDGKLLVDGGIGEVLPVEFCRKLGASSVIGVDLYGSTEPPPINLKGKKDSRPMSALAFLGEKIRGGKSQRMTLIKVIEATIAVIQKNLTALRLAACPADLVIRPRVREVGALDFHRSEAVIEIGRIAAREALPKVKELLSRTP